MKRIPRIFKNVNWYLVFVLIVQNYIDGTLLMGLVLLYLIYTNLKTPRIYVTGKIHFIYLILIILSGTLIGLFNIQNCNTRDFLRDIYYNLQPFLYIYAGYIFAKKNSYQYDFYMTIIVAALFVSGCYIIQILLNPSVLLSATVVDIRTDVGKEVFIELIALVFLLTRKTIFDRRNVQIIATIIIASAIVLQFSRALYGMLFITLVVYFILQKKITVKMLKHVFYIILAIVIIWILLPNALTEDFTARILNSLTEVTPNVTYNTVQDLQSNWRGYEVYMVMNEFKSGSLFNQLFGFGYGKTVHLAYTVNLGGENFNDISAFHNGYIYILLKNGIFGLLCFGLFYVSILKNFWRDKNYNAKLVVSLTFGMLFLTYIKGGILRGSSVIEYCLFIGFSAMQKDDVKRDEKSIA